MTKVTKPERNPLDDIAAELAIANAHFQEHNALLAEQTSLIKSKNRSIESGVELAGFKTTQFPAAIAGASFQAAIRSGKFQGII